MCLCVSTRSETLNPCCLCSLVSPRFLSGHLCWQATGYRVCVRLNLGRSMCGDACHSISDSSQLSPLSASLSLSPSLPVCPSFRLPRLPFCPSPSAVCFLHCADTRRDTWVSTSRKTSTVGERIGRWYMVYADTHNKHTHTHRIPAVSHALECAGRWGCCPVGG